MIVLTNKPIVHPATSRRDALGPTIDFLSDATSLLSGES
jgi:hypothetical protein